MASTVEGGMVRVYHTADLCVHTGLNSPTMMPTSSCVRDSGCPAATWTISHTRSTPVMHSVMGCST